jgi:TorA maturation chaperone TorD
VSAAVNVRTATVGVFRALSPEDQARADCYAVIARLFAGPPDRELLTMLRDAPRFPDDDGIPLAAAWNRLLDASGAMDADAARQEYDDLFIGVGRSEVNVHGSHWRSGFMMEKPLADLRSELALLGLARKGETTMVEDHLSALCETMRLLIAGDVERQSAALETQRNFFEKQLLPWVFDCCAAIQQSTLANYYRRVAEFVELFMAVERDSLAMD